MYSSTWRKRRLWRNLINVCKYLKGRCKEDRARLFSVVPCSRTSGNGEKLKYRKVHQNTRRQFCFVRVVKYWHIRFRVAIMSNLSSSYQRTEQLLQYSKGLSSSKQKQQLIKMLGEKKHEFKIRFFVVVLVKSLITREDACDKDGSACEKIHADIQQRILVSSINVFWLHASPCLLF